ncbi:unnamed protein product [Litomosoides sigmodontis]|uniref:CUE domain-containing protein n=1 Tax=Litomosoides sigmodontis TaxID=42156 RepID=A0A3P7JKC5_LITSI|nr:unnamed protein product [Litomosoides sigmodontis]
MPLMVLDPFDGLLALARHTPIPTLNSYIIISVESRLGVISETFRKIDHANALVTSSYFQQFCYILLHPTFGWVFINMFCATLALIAKLVTHMTVGKLGVQESVLLRDRLCNFLLYKAVFLFGVLNSVVHEEIIAWILWFALLASVAALQSIIAYKLKYLISSVPPRRVILRIMGLAFFLLLISATFVSSAFIAFRLFSVSIALFILADAIKSLLRSVYVIFKSALLMDNVSIYLPSINLTTLTYYVEFLHDLAIDCIDLLHYTHMLARVYLYSMYQFLLISSTSMYSQVVLSMACIVISMQLRSFYKSFIGRIERHIKYKRICKHIDIQCLQSWLEQDSSCPTCRLALPSSSNSAVTEDTQERLRAPTMQPFSHVFHFSGTRYARWLPSFSVELSHNVTPDFFNRNRFGSATNSQLISSAEQIREMFPQLEMAAILEDLRESGSVQATVENILENRFRHRNVALDSGEEIWNAEDVPSSSSSSTESSGEYEETLTPSEPCLNSCSVEHRDMFLRRKDILIQHHRKKYIASHRGKDLRNIYGKDVPNTSDPDSFRQRGKT